MYNRKKPPEDLKEKAKPVEMLYYQIRLGQFLVKSIYFFNINLY